MKNQTFFLPARNLRVAMCKRATGPYGPSSQSSTMKDAEAPSVLHTSGYWYVYYDAYTKGHYSVARTRDFKTWEPFSDSLQTPRGIRHGSAFLAPESVLRGLMALDSTGR